MQVVSASKSCCRNCTYVFVAKETSDEYRCGLTYYKLPALSRNVRPMKAYPMVRAEDICADWKLSSKGLNTL